MPQTPEDRSALQGIVQRMVEAGEPEENIALVIREFQPPTAPPTGQGITRDAFLKHTNELDEQNAEQLEQNTPAILGAVTGLATGGMSLIPALAAQAGVVGGTRAISNLSRGDGLGDALTQGLVAAGSEGVGRGVGAGLQKAGNRVYQSVLKPTATVRREFPDIVQTGLQNRVPVSPAGTEQAQGLMRASSARLDPLLQQAQATGARPISLRELTPELRGVRDTAKQRVGLGLPDETPAIANRVKAMRKAHPLGDIELTDAQTLKQTAQDLANKVYRAQDRGAVVTDLGADTNAALARGLRKGIETRVPEAAGINQETQRLMGLTRALEGAEGRIGNTLPIGMGDLIGGGLGIGTGLATGNPLAGLATYAGAKALNTPAVASRAAIGMNEVGQSQAIEQVLRALLLSMLSGTSETP